MNVFAYINVMFLELKVMIINSVPKRLFGTTVIVAAIWTTFTIGGVFGSAHTKLTDGLIKIKEKIGISKEIQDHTGPDPQYKVALNFLGSWFMGQQVGEDAVSTGTGLVSNSHVKQIQTILPFIRNQGDPFSQAQVPVLENALHIYEILLKLVDPNIANNLKTEMISQLNDKIFDAADTEEVLIPVSWMGAAPGGTLISLSKESSGYHYVNIYDTVHNFEANESFPGNYYPSVKSPVRRMRIKDPNEVREHKKIILALLVMLNDSLLKSFDANYTQDERLLLFFKSFFGFREDQGYKYYIYAFLPMLNNEQKLDPPTIKGIEIPFRRLVIGPLADVLGFLSVQYAHANNSNTERKYKFWRLALGYDIIKAFLDRFGNDADIHLEARDQNVVSEIVKRSASGLLRDAIELAMLSRLIPEQVSNDDKFFELLNSQRTSPAEKDKLERVRQLDFTIKELKTILLKPSEASDDKAKERAEKEANIKAEQGKMQKDRAKRMKEIADKKKNQKFETNLVKLIFERIEGLSEINLVAIAKSLDGISIKDAASIKPEQKTKISTFLNALKADKRQKVIATLKSLFDRVNKDNSLKAAKNEITEKITKVLGILESKKPFKDDKKAEVIALVRGITMPATRTAAATNPPEIAAILTDLNGVLTETGKLNLLNQLKTGFGEVTNEVAEPLIEEIIDLLQKKKEKIAQSSSGADDKKIDMFAKVIKLRKTALNWLKGKDTDTYKLSKISRSLGQREMNLKQTSYFGIQSYIEMPIDLTKYLPSDNSDPDLSNCMAGSKRIITNIEEFIDAFSQMKTSWKWFKFAYDIDNPHCKPYLRRNAELLLRNLRLGGLDHESLKKWTPKTQRQYKNFLATTNSLLGTIISLPNSERTLEDYIIILRIQRIVWRVAQALDFFFAKKETHRHLDLLQYSLSYPQCHNLLKNKLTYSNYFLADSGAYGNILNTESMTELKNLCKDLIDEENSAKPVLNYEHYMRFVPILFERTDFDRIDPGDREIYFKMAQNPLISRVVRENRGQYNYGGENVAENAAKAVSIGELGGQFIYYQFFDALRIIFTTNIAIKQPVNTLNFIDFAYIPLKFSQRSFGSVIATIPRKLGVNTNLTPVNEELIKKGRKSYSKVSIIEMLTSHILGLDVLLNHLGRGSAKFWSTGNIIEEKAKTFSFSGFNFVDDIMVYAEEYKEFFDILQGKQPDNTEKKLIVKACRRDIAGTADFLLNCSSHLLRKLDVAPGYEELVMSLLMKSFHAVDEDLMKTLKDMENMDMSDVTKKKKSEETEKKDKDEEIKQSQDYLKNSKTSPDEYLKSLINWATIAIRFSARVRSLKPEWKGLYPDVATKLYGAMSKYSAANTKNNRLLAPLNQFLASHVDYVLFMICAMNPNDPNLRREVYQNLNPGSTEDVQLPQDESILSAAMLFHRLLALNNYEYDRNGPLTEDFISQQFAISQVMEAINSSFEHNETLLKILARYMSTLLTETPAQILENYAQGDNLLKGYLVYGRFSINLIQGSVMENGRKARNPNDILRHKLFRQFFSAGSEQLAVSLGLETENCPIRYEVQDFLQKGTKYSICEYRSERRIAIYRHIPRFKRPCKLVLQKSVIEALQYAFSIYPNVGIDVYHCKRGNNANFVWIGRNAVEPMYTSHGRLWILFEAITSKYFETKQQTQKTSDVFTKKLSKKTATEFKFNVKTVLTDMQLNLLERFLAPTIFFPRLEIKGVYEDSVYPLTAESKMMVVPEPMVRFSGGSRFGSYTNNNNLIFMFQQFRFRDRPEVALTFIEGSDGNLEMKGRQDLQICEDQIFENNFWPALMMKKIDESGNELRFAYVPITNLENPDEFDAESEDETVDDNPTLMSPLTLGSSTSASGPKSDPNEKESAKSADANSDTISVVYDPESENKFNSDGSSKMIFMEAMAVQKGSAQMKNDKDETIYQYNLKPSSRLQRILLAYYHLNLRNYDECLKLLDPRNEIDHNTKLTKEEKRIFKWMVNLSSAQDPEALALRFMAKIHLILDKELFPGNYKNPKGMSNSVGDDEKLAEMTFNNDNDLIKAYEKRNLPVERPGLRTGASSYLGGYFTYMHVLPKRFHIDYVFQEAMSSHRVLAIIYKEYMEGMYIPGPSTQLNGGLKLADSCQVSRYIDYNDILTQYMVDRPSADEVKKLPQYIENRYTFNYLAKDCDLAPILCHHIIHVYGAKENKGKKFHELNLKEVQELAVLYLQFKTTVHSTIDRMLFSLIHPSQSHNFDVIRSQIDLEVFADELKIKYDEHKNPLPRNFEKLNRFSYQVFANSYKLNPSIFHALISSENQENLALAALQTLFKKVQYNKADAGRFLSTLKPRAELTDDINSIKLTSEDFHYIGQYDREVIGAVIEAILESTDNSDKGMTNSGLVELNGIESKTQKALKKAIDDYIKDPQRKKPVKFDELIKKKDKLVKLEALIDERSGVLKSNLETLKERYENFFKQLKYHGKNDELLVVVSLKRMFDNNKQPSLMDLRDCLMQMKYSCLQNHFPDLSKESITKILQILKEFYIQQIILNNFTVVKSKIGEVSDLAGKAGKAEAELKSIVKSAENKKKIAELKAEIFGHKDTALLVVDEILVSMEKLLLLETRLQDPVTLNFEFMSAKYHLTNVQVQDIANLSTRQWEDKMNKELFEEIGLYKRNLGKNADAARISRVTRDHLTSLRTKGRPYLIGPFSRYLKLKARFGKSPGDEAWMGKTDKPEEMWMYLPRQERLIKSDSPEITEHENYYQRRPLLRNLKAQGIGELRPYNTEKDSYFSRVIQRKMAAGKTTVLGTAATVKKADGKTLSVLVILSSLYQSSAPDMQKRTSEYFKTRGFAFSMPHPRLTVPLPFDTKHPARNFLTWTLKMIVNTINTNGYLVVTPETLQAFLNSYVEYLDAFVNTPTGKANPELSHCLHLFATIYEIFRQRGSIILDEIDSSMRPQKELNFPTSKRENILVPGVELTSDLLLHSAISKDIVESGLNLLANQQAALNEDQYKLVREKWYNYIEKQLNTRGTAWHDYFHSHQHSGNYNTALLMKFFFNPAADSDFMIRVHNEHPQLFHLMMIIRMQLKEWLRSCFKGAVNEHYGPAINRPDQKEILYAIPYLAAKTPAEGSIFADRWETVNKTFMMYLIKDFDVEELSRIIADLRNLAQNNVQNIDLKGEFTKACPGMELLNVRFNAQNKIIDKDEVIMKCMKARSIHSLNLIFYWVTHSIFEQEEFFAEQITSNAINLTTMFPSVQGYSGTIDNVNVLPHQVMVEAEKDHDENEKANGAITMKLLQQENCVTTVQKIEDIREIDKLLDSMCRDFKDLSVFSAFIDVGALLKDYNNSDVAFALAKKFNRRVILYYDELSNKLNYLEYDPKTLIKQSASLEGSETNYLNSATNSFVNDRFTYYDQRHITGSDILQPPTAKAFLTIGPKVLLRDILQGVMRMRQFQSGQSIHFITTSSVESLLDKYCKGVKPVKGDEPRVNQKHLITLGALNEDEKQLSENVRLYRVKIDAEIRAFVLDRMTEALAEQDPFEQRSLLANHPGSHPHPDPITFKLIHEQLFKSTRPLFIRDVRENPINWATINTEEAAAQVVQEYMNKRLRLVPDCWKEGAYKSEWDKVIANLNIITQSDSSNAQYARSVLKYLGPTLEKTKIPDGFKVTSSSETIALGSELEMQLQLEVQQELNVELDQKIEDNQDIVHLPEPELLIPEADEGSSLESLMVAKGTCPVMDPVNRRLEKIDKLLTPWKLFEFFRENVSSGSDLMRLYETDLLCPGWKKSDDLSKYCSEVKGFVGLSKGLARTTSSGKFDFATMTSREATHLLFWKGKETDGTFKHAIFLISGSEAFSLHQHWGFRSCSISEVDSYWLTDLYGFEVHGSPFAETSVGSQQFSLLEEDYRKHFAKLHFRALVLNGSYNVIMASREMFYRFRIWTGDNELDKDPDVIEGETKRRHVSVDEAAKRANVFLIRMIWMSKLREEIIPQDPFVEYLLRLVAKTVVDYGKLDELYEEEHVSHDFESIESWKMRGESLIQPETDEAKPWPASGNINKAGLKNWTMILIVTTVIIALVVIGLIWGYSSGINWIELMKSTFSKKSKQVEEVEEDTEMVEQTEAEAAGVSN